MVCAVSGGMCRRSDQYSGGQYRQKCTGTVLLWRPRLAPMPSTLSPDFLALLALGTAMSFTPGPNTTLSTALAANLGLSAVWMGQA
jgi:hypothetical protein